ncbi:MAG: hypothetical protein M0R17_01060 [Candidatus Omnitrophica bacterium]|jgi:hypothetical protein|nr:hypothetical protein [Candidatus Omnitrophota bacterium]
MNSLYVFWKYDLYPYCLGDKAKEILPNGNFRVYGYQEMIVKPIMILEESEGIALMEKIQELKENYEKECSELKTRYKKELFKIAPFIPEHTLYLKEAE